MSLLASLDSICFLFNLQVGVLADDIPRVNYTRDPPENDETDVDQEVGAAATLHENRCEWDENSKKIEKHIALQVG